MEPEAPPMKPAPPSPGSRTSFEARKIVAFTFIFSVIACAGVAWRSRQEHRNIFPVALHAIPEFELFAAAAPELSSDRSEIQPKQQQLFARLIGPGIAFINPPPALNKPADIVAQRQPAAAAVPPATVAPPSPRHGIVISDREIEIPRPLKREDAPWVLASRLPPRPKPRAEQTLEQTLALKSLSGVKGAIELAATTDAGVTEVLDVRPGVVLIGKDGAFNETSSLYNGAVVLLLKVCGCHPSIFGLILNHRSEETMADAFCPLAAARYPSFVNNSILVGGPVGPMWSLLHKTPLEDSHQIIPGLHVGGSLYQLQKQVSYGAAQPLSAAAFVSGYSAWPIERLQAELDAGKWRAFELDDAARLHPLLFDKEAAHGKVAVAASA